MFNGYPNYSYANNYSAPQYQGYAPQMQQPVRQAQPQMQPQVQQMPTAQMPYDLPIQDIRFVTSEEAKAFIVLPNTKVLLIDRQNKIANLKTADNLGQSTSQFFRFEPINPDGTPIVPQEAPMQFNIEDLTKRFATIDQFNELNSKMERIISEKEIVAPTTKKSTKEQ